MRQAFLDTLIRLVEQDRSVMLLTADTGFHVFDEFQKLYPDNYCNVGISEAVMIGVAAGLAVEGRKVFVYGIAPFVTLRCFEQIRVDLCYQKLPVKIVGVGAGFTYGPAGPSHHTIEDIAVMRALPEMTVICPGDPREASAAVLASMDLTSPCYLRLGKSGEPVVHRTQDIDFVIGKGITIRKGIDIAVIATGNMLPTGLVVCEMLDKQDISAGLISMPTVKPVDRDLIIDLANDIRFLATLEEHNVIGGLGAAVGEVLTDEGISAKLLKFAIPDQYAETAGSHDFLRKKYGLDSDSIARTIVGILKG